MPKNKKLAFKLGIHPYQILTNRFEVCIPSLSSIFLAVGVHLRVAWSFAKTHGIELPSATPAAALTDRLGIHATP